MLLAAKNLIHFMKTPFLSGPADWPGNALIYHRPGDVSPKMAGDGAPPPSLV
jgi:hypothetical protein